LRESVESAEKATTDSERLNAIRAIQRRVDSVQSSLISIRVYCHSNASVIQWANRVEDTMDNMSAITRKGP